MGDQHAPPILVDLLRERKAHVEVLRATANALGQLGGQETIPAIIALAEQGSGFGLVLALRALVGISRRYPNQSVIDLAMRLLRESDAPVRALAAAVLAASRAESAVPALAAVLSGYASDRRLLAETLGAIGGNSAIALLGELARDEDLAVRTHAIWALGRLGAANALPIALLVLESPHPAERAAAAAVLARLGSPPEALATLHRLAADDATAVQKNALVALRQSAPLTGGTDFFAMELIDSSRQPVADSYYELELPNGLIKVGWTNAAGLIYEDGLPPGKVSVNTGEPQRL